MAGPNPGVGHLLGRDLVYIPLAEESLIIGEGGEVKELSIGNENQVLTIISGELQWANAQTTAAATGDNLGLGARILESIDGSFFHFRTLTEGDGIIITEGAEEILIEVDETFLLTLSQAGTLGTPTDGSFTNPRFPGGPLPAILDWTTSTLVVDAVDDLNEVMGLLVPDPPLQLGVKTLIIIGGASTREGANILLASGVTDNTGGGIPAPGAIIFRVNSTTVQTDTITEFGPGNTGSLSAEVNGVVNGTIVLDSSDNSGTDGALTISSDTDFPISTPGFHRALDAFIQDNVPIGVNKYQMTHSADGDTNEAIFLFDDVSTTPTASGLSVAELAPGTLLFSSSIPHYQSGATVSVDATVDELASKAYLSAGVIQISGPGTQIDLNPGDSGLPAFFSSGLAPQTVTAQEFVVGGTTTTGQIGVRGRNANATGSFTFDPTLINVLGSGGVQELSVPVSVGTLPGGADSDAKRVIMSAGDTPPDDKSALLVSDWVSANALQTHDASVVAGVLKYDVTDYTTGFLPVGPDLSGQDANQYITWFFRRSTVSKFKIDVTGTYTDIRVTLVDVNFGIAPNNWLDMFDLYTGAGVPGLNGSDGCANGVAATGSTGIFECTFGTETSSNATSNIIMVRFKMTAGDQITALSFTA